MKKIILGLSLMMLFLNVNAMEINSESDFDTCIQDSNTCVLQKDLELSEKKVIEDGKSITLDLNGYEITYNGTTTIKHGLIVVNHGAKLIVNDSNNTGKINPGNKTYAAIALTNTGDTDNSKVAELIINGGNISGYYYAIVGNGIVNRDNTKITINGGNISGTNTGDNLGIYHPQNGLITINGGTISGVTGIELRAGKLVVNGGKIVGDYTSLSMDPNGDGSTTMGAGIAIMQHTTSLTTILEVNDGIIEGYAAVAQKKIQSNADDSLVSISLKGGTYNTLNGGTEVVYSETKTAFITGGTYSNDLASSYIPDNYKVEEENSKYVVSAIKNAEATISDGTVLFETEDTLDKDYVLIVTEKDSNSKSNVENKVKNLLKNDTNKSNINLISLYEIDIEDGLGQVVSMSDGTYTISIPISIDMQKFSNYQVIYVDNSGNISETLNATLVGGKVVFTTSHLSTYGIVGYNETNPNTYDSINLSIILACLSFISMIILGLYINKNKRFN